MAVDISQFKVTPFSTVDPLTGGKLCSWSRLMIMRIDSICRSIMCPATRVRFDDITRLHDDD